MQYQEGTKIEPLEIQPGLIFDWNSLLTWSRKADCSQQLGYRYWWKTRFLLVLLIYFLVCLWSLVHVKVNRENNHGVTNKAENLIRALVDSLVNEIYKFLLVEKLTMYLKCPSVTYMSLRFAYWSHSEFQI